MINVSPDNLPLDIELEDANDLAAVIRAVCECDTHTECQESPLKIQLVSPQDIPNGSINPTATAWSQKWERELERRRNELYKAAVDWPANRHDDKQDAAIYAQPGAALNVDTTEQRRDWITDQLNEWYSSQDGFLPNGELNKLTLKIDDMIGSGIWAPSRTVADVKLDLANAEVDRLRKELDAMRPAYNPESPVPISEASYQRARKLFATWQAEAVTHNISGQEPAINFFAAKLARVFDENQNQVNCLKDKVDTAERKIEEARIELNNLSNERAYPDPTEALANAYEEREHSDNAWAVGYMRKRIQELEAERANLVHALGTERERMGTLRTQHSNQHDELNKLFKMIEGWGWTAGNWDEWLKVFVEQLVKNAQQANSAMEDLSNRLNMRTGELQEAIRIKDEVLDENKKLVAENIHLRREHARISDDRDRHMEEAQGFLADLNKIKRGYDRLNAKYQKLREKLKA